MSALAAAAQSPMISPVAALGWAAVKTLSLFVVAVVGLRLSERRVIPQLNVFDFIVTVAVGAIIGHRHLPRYVNRYRSGGADQPAAHPGC